jgi:hypothetical protein
MSLTTLKRKTDGSYHVNGGLQGQGYVNKISSGRPAFSLNDSRRVEGQTGRQDITTRMRGTGYRGHGGYMGTFTINPILARNKNDYDPFGKPRRGKPVIIAPCPVVQQVNPLHYDILYQEQDATLIKKELCSPEIKSGTCTNAVNFPPNLGRRSSQNSYQVSNFVKRPQMDYSQYIQKKKAPLAGKDKHYPPMVLRNSGVCTSFSNFSYSDFISRVTCK